MKKHIIFMSHCCPNQPMNNWPESDICPNCGEHTGVDAVNICAKCNDFLEEGEVIYCEVCARLQKASA